MSLTVDASAPVIGDAAAPASCGWKQAAALVSALRPPFGLPLPEESASLEELASALKPPDLASEGLAPAAVESGAREALCPGSAAELDSTA